MAQTPDKKLLIGRVFKEVVGELVIGSTVFVNDNTIPQITEGNAIAEFNFNYTPERVGSTIIISSKLHIGNTTFDTYIAAMFIDSVADAVKSSSLQAPAANQPVILSIKHKIITTSLTPINFQVRASGTNATSNTLNTGSGGNSLGETLSSWVLLEEFLV